MSFLLPLQPSDPLTPRHHRLQAQWPPGTRILKAKDVASWTQAEGLLQAAQEQADALLLNARQVLEEHKAQGFAEGMAQARMEQAEKMLDTVDRTISYFSQVEGDMVDLVMSAMRKIMADFDDEARVLAVVKNALAVVRNQKQMTLRLPPDRVELVRAHINDLLAAYPGVGYLDIVADARLKSDACILESEIGLVEASIEGQLAALENAFRKVLGSRV